MFAITNILVMLLLLMIALDIALLYQKKGITGSRILQERMSHGDDNRVILRIKSSYKYPVKIDIIDEIPEIFQNRDICFKESLKKEEDKRIEYYLRPTQRGEYIFGNIIVLVYTKLGLVQRKYKLGSPQSTKVYPSYLKLRQYELIATQHNSQNGTKKVRRIANQTEFEQIKEYVKGDEYRHINWKASARSHKLMTNVYQEERSQDVYVVIDKSRVMQHSFKRIKMLDYAINSALSLSYIAMNKEDKVGLITFGKKIYTQVLANRNSNQLQKISEVLYNEDSIFVDSDFEELYLYIKRKINRKSLFTIYTDFANIKTMKRQIKYLNQIAKSHKVVVIIFNDNDINDVANTIVKDTDSMYRKIAAEKYMSDKKHIIYQLRKNNISTILSYPEDLSVNVINKYIEIKSNN